MYTNSNNRIITKYSEFVLQQNAETLQPLKRVTSSQISASADDLHELLSDSSGDEGEPRNKFSSPRTKTVISAEIHHHSNEDSGEQVEFDPKMTLDTVDIDPDRYPDPPPLPVSDQVKFSDIFTPEESHALFQRSLLLKSEAGRFLVEAAGAGGHVKSRSDSDLVVLASKISSRASAAGISRGPPESGDDDYPVRPLNPHPHPGNISPSSSIADLTSMSMRRELLNNIRAISRATFFENLYTGAAGGNTTEMSKDRVANSNPDIATFLQSASRRSHRPETVVSERGELLVFEKMSSDSAAKRESIDLWIKSSKENLNDSFPTTDADPDLGLEPEPDPVPEPEPETLEMSTNPYAKAFELYDMRNSAVSKALHMLELNNNHSSEPKVFELNSTISFDSNVPETMHDEKNAPTEMSNILMQPEVVNNSDSVISVLHVEHEVFVGQNGDVVAEPESKDKQPLHEPEPEPRSAASVPEPDYRSAAIMHEPELRSSAVPEPIGATVPEPEPRDTTVTEPEPRGIAVPETEPSGAAVPEPEPRGADVPEPKGAITLPDPTGAAAAVPEPEHKPEPWSATSVTEREHELYEPDHITDILLITGTIEEYEPEPEPESTELIDIPDVGPNFLEKTDSSDSNAENDPDPTPQPKFQPIFNRIESPAIPTSEPAINRQKTPSPKPKSFLTNMLNSNINRRLSKQVRYPSVLPRRSPILIDSRRNRRVGKLPGILKRQNMDQWVAKIVWFYINGDRHFPRFEYRFRPGRDIRSWDGLCDILSNRLKLTRGVRYIFTTSGLPVNSVDDLQHSGSYVVSSVRKFKALNYGGELLSPDEDGPETLKRRPPSAPTQRKPPIIRIRRERSLNGVSWGSPQQQLSGGSETNNNNNNPTIPTVSTKSRPSLLASSREAERVLREVIGQARPVEKQVVRIINGVDPSVQSQVLLNTKVAQDWDDLVKDLGMAVKIPRRHECRMETLTGRQIQSYSQLRSELKAGNQAFYVYTTPPAPGKNSRTGSQNDLSSTSGIPLHFHSSTSLNKIKNNITQNDSVSTSISNPMLASRKERSRRRGTFGIATSNTNLLQVQESADTGSNPLRTKKSVSSSSLYEPTESSIRKSKSLSNNTLSPASSQSNLAGLQRRRSTRRRSQASTYLALRSRSPSPEYNNYN